MDSTIEKSILGGVMLIITAIMAMIPFAPLKIFRSEINSKFHSIASCFSGGVFISVCFLDMIPDIEEMFEKIKNTGHFTWEYPLSGFVICMGFFFVFVTDQIILMCKETPESQGYRFVCYYNFFADPFTMSKGSFQHQNKFETSNSDI